MVYSQPFSQQHRCHDSSLLRCYNVFTSNCCEVKTFAIKEVIATVVGSLYRSGGRAKVRRLSEDERSGVTA